MHLYNLTLQRPGAVNSAVFGNFTAPRQAELAVSHGRTLELLRPDEAGKLQVIGSTDVFGLIRSLLALRLFGTDKDYLVISSDSGRLTIVEWDKEGRGWKRVHMETYGKTGMRRITPGQYLAADPKGRAVMVSAVEKQKLVYTLNRTPTEPLTISSPLEAHKSHALVWDVVGADVGMDNPLFAALEVDYADADSDPSGEAAANSEKCVVYYEMDLGLNTMTRKWSRATDRGANMLVPVPGGADGPGGVLVCAENWVLYEHSAAPAALRTPLPRRADMPDERGLLIVAKAVHRQKGGGFFALLQSELGDLYKVTLTTVKEGDVTRVTDVVVSFFDTLPPASSLCITRTGLLFVASEFGNHLLYQFTGLGDAHDGSSSSSSGSGSAVAHSIHIEEGAEAVEVVCPTFEPRPLANLSKLDELPSMAPITDMRVIPASATAAGSSAVASSGGATGPQIVALCGRGPRSTLRLLREGASVSDLAVSPMPGNPMGVFTLKASNAPHPEGGSPPDRYIVISFTNATLVLSVGDAVEEVPAKEIGFLESVPTLGAVLLGDDSLLQVHSGGMRLFKAKRTTQWQSPGKRAVVKAACNARQVVLALSGGELVYFELDEAGNLNERGRKGLGAEMTSLALGAIPEGRLRAPHLAVGDSNNMVRILSLDPAALFAPQASQALRSGAESLAIVNLRVHGPTPSPHLFIGLSNGIMTRVALDERSGQLTDPRSRFLGVRPVKLAPVTVAGAPAAMALSSRPWLHYNLHGGYHASPLSYETLEAAAPFSTAAVPEGIVAIAGNTLRIFTLDRLGEALNQRSLSLRYTPRRIAMHPTDPRYAVVIESDYNAMTVAQREAATAAAASGGASSSEEDGAAAEPAAPSTAAENGSSSSSSAATAAAAASDEMEMDMEMEMETDDVSAGAAAANSSSTSSASGAGAASSQAQLPGGVASSSSSSSAAASALTPFPPGSVPPHSTSTPGEALPDAEALAAGVTSVDPFAEGSVDVRRVGPPLPSSPGCWASAVRVVDLGKLTDSDAAEAAAPSTSLHNPRVTHHLFDLPADVAALCVTTATFHDHPGHVFVLVGVAHGLRYHPRTHSGGAIHTYRMFEQEVGYDASGKELPPGVLQGAVAVGRVQRLQFYHATPLEEPPTALAPLAGRVLVGTGRSVRMYDLGKRRLLRKCEMRGLPTVVTSLSPVGVDRVFVGDAAESVHAVKYKRAENALVAFADDVVPRAVTCLTQLDPDTVAVGDKFGNVAVLRIPDDVSDDADNPTGNRLLWDSAVLNGAPHKLETVAQYYVGEAVTSLQKTPMGSGKEVLLYSTISGSLGGMLPLTAKEDSDFFRHLELFLRAEDDGNGCSLVGRDHVSYRSYFLPVKNVVDGDLCEAFSGLVAARQKTLSEELDRTPNDVLKKLEDIRNKML